MSEIEVTVGLPLFRARQIAWLALESLCNQRKAPAWELIISEEIDPRFDPLGEKGLEKYYQRLYAANCVNVSYIPIPEWIPLSYKWQFTITHSQGKILLLQAADCYSQPYRIYETYQLMKNKGDWCQSQKGYFYSIQSEKLYVFDATKNDHPCALNMALNIDLGRQLPEQAVTKGVDKWLFQSLEKIKCSPLNVKLNRSVHWKLGIDTHGLGNISRRETSFKKKNIWTESNISLGKILPIDYVVHLKLLKTFARKFNDYRPWENR